MDESNFTFKRQVHNWLEDAEMEHANISRQSCKKGSKSSSLGSFRRAKTSSSGSKSNRSSKEKVMEEKAKAAELIAEAEFLPYKQLAENQGERSRVQEKLAKAKARSQVHKDMGEGVTLNQKIMGLEKAKDTRKGQREKDGCSGRSIKQVITEERRQDLLMYHQIWTEWCVICCIISHYSEPEVQIETFRGDPLEYHYFTSVFREVVELKIGSPHGKLVRLLKYTEGDVRGTIKHCI